MMGYQDYLIARIVERNLNGKKGMRKLILPSIGQWLAGVGNNSDSNSCQRTELLDVWIYSVPQEHLVNHLAVTVDRSVFS